MEIYTIGYEGVSQSSFIAWLTGNNIDILADIRYRPQSRKKGFSKNGLRDSLSENGIEYLGVPSLGVPKDMRDRLKATGDYKSFFKRYRESLSTKKQDVQDLIRVVESGKRVALLCFERDATKCHRSVLAEQIRAMDSNGSKVVHLEPL